MRNNMKGLLRLYIKEENNLEAELYPTSFRATKNKLKKTYVVKIRKAKNGDLVIPIPKPIVKAYSLEIGDVAIFEIIGKMCLLVTFVKKTMCSVVE